MKKIAFLSTVFVEADATSNYLFNNIDHARKSYDVTLLVFSRRCQLPPNVKTLYFSKRRTHDLLSELYAFKSILSTAKKLISYDLIVVQTHFFFPALLAKYLNPRLKLVYDFHGFTPEKFYKSLREKILQILRIQLIKFFILFCESVIVHSKYAKKEFKSSFKTQQIFVLPCGVDLSNFYPDRKISKKMYGLDKKFTLIYVGRLVHHKNIEFLIKNLSKLDEDVHLIIVGDGAEKEHLKNYAKSLKVYKRVLFTGKVSTDKLRKFYSISDIFVTASHHELFCIPIIESFACGTPVLVPRKAVMLERVNGTGLTFDPYNSNDFVDKVYKFKCDSNLRKRMSKKALLEAKKYDISCVKKNFDNILKKILGENKNEDGI